MLLIADCGSTKVDWRAIAADGSVKSVNTEGINPVFLSSEDISKILEEKVVPAIGTDVKEIYFYGAGILAPELAKVLSDAFDKVFPGNKSFVASDLLAAARALCGHSAGIACIMGTGANTCFYDGEEIVNNVRAGGFILGDEASGGVLGKKLMADFIKGLLPKEIEEEFVKRYDLDYMKIVQKVYREPLPSKWLASFSPFISEFRDNPHINNLIRTSFDEFFKRNIVHYDYKNYPVNLVGSIAHYYEDILKDVAAQNGATIGKIIKSPIDGLVEYHTNAI